MTVISKRRSACAAACIIMLGALTACAKREESARAAMAVEPSMSEAAPLTVTPPPSRAASIERQLAGLGAEQSDRGLVVQLPGGQFAPGQTRFEPAETTRMERVADLLRERPELQVRVIGHTDSRGSQAVNARIARERAEAAREALIALGDIDPQRIAAEGVGEVQPVAPLIIGTNASIAPLTAFPSAPDELSTCSSAGESRSIRRIAPSAAVAGSLRATVLISETASLIRVIAVDEDLHEKTLGRMRLGNSHL